MATVTTTSPKSWTSLSRDFTLFFKINDFITKGTIQSCFTPCMLLRIILIIPKLAKVAVQLIYTFTNHIVWIGMYNTSLRKGKLIHIAVTKWTGMFVSMSKKRLLRDMYIKILQYRYTHWNNVTVSSDVCFKSGGIGTSRWTDDTGGSTIYYVDFISVSFRNSANFGSSRHPLQ